jgi:hypothetical protein
MEEKHLLETWKIDVRDWQETPVAVKHLVVCLGKELEFLKQQIQELTIQEHRLHQLVCSECGQKTRAALPAEVEASGYTERVVGIVSLLSGMYRHSHRMVVAAMSDFFGVKMSVGSVNRLRTEASQAVAMPVTEAQAYVQQQPLVGADETGFRQGNADGNNGLKKKAWLWVAVTPLVSFFSVMLSRSTEAAQSLLGKNFEGILNSDRYSAYNWLDVSQRQQGTGASETRIYQNLGAEWCCR